MSLEFFEEMKTLVGFSQADRDNLLSLKSRFRFRIPGIAEDIHDSLKRTPATAELARKQGKAMKDAHIHWMNGLFEGEYEADYFHNRQKIGTEQVASQWPPHLVEGIFSQVRSRALEIVLEEQPKATQASRQCDSILKILDLDLLIIHCAFREERLNRIFEITGINRQLVDRLIEHGGAVRPH